MRAWLAILAFLAGVTAALGQTVTQAGPTTPNHVPMYYGSGFGQPVIGDGGGSGGSTGVPGGLNPSEIGITSPSQNGVYPSANSGHGPHGEHFCLYDAPVNNPTGYHYFCLDANATGGGLLAYGSGGAAAQLPLTINGNGITQTFPFPVPTQQLVTVPSSAALAGYASPSIGLRVWRQGYAQIGDGGQGGFTYYANNCALLGYVNDGGACVNSTSSTGAYLVDPNPSVQMALWGLTPNNSGIDSAPAVRAAVAYAAKTGATLVPPASGAYYLNSTDATNGGLGAIVAGIKPASALSAGAATNATTLSLTSVTGLTTGSPIGVQLTSGDVWHSTLTGPPSGLSVTIASGIPSGASINAPVWFYGAFAAPTFTMAGPNPVLNRASCSISQAYFILGAGINRPALYVHPDVASPTLYGVCFDGARAGQTGWPGAETGRGLLETIEIADGTPPTNESSINLSYAAVTGGYNGDMYAGATRGSMIIDKTWFMFSGQTTADYALYFNGVDVHGVDPVIGENTGSAILFAEGAQYQFEGGAIFQNGLDGVDIAGGQVTYLNWANLNIQQSGCYGVREYSSAPLAGTVAVSHVFVNTTFDGNSHTTTGTCYDILNDSAASYLSFVNPQFVGNEISGGTVPLYNVYNSSSGYVKLTAPTFGSPSFYSGGGITNLPAQLQCANCIFENSWLPVLAGSSTPGTPGYITNGQVGTWSRNNNEVTLKFFIQISSFSGPPTGNMTIAGLPLSAAATANDFGVCTISDMVGVTLDSGFTTLTGIIGSNGGTINLYEIGSTKTGQPTPISDYSLSATVLAGQCVYDVNN